MLTQEGARKRILVNRGLDIDECYRELAISVIEQAAKDYIRADRFERKNLIDFFHSETFYLYTNNAIDPEVVIDYLNEKRRWNKETHSKIISKYGGYEEFAKKVGPKYSAYTAKSWTRGLYYPPELKIWRRLLTDD